MSNENVYRKRYQYQIEIKDGANSFLAGDGKYVELDVYATPGSNATILSF